MYSSWSVFFTFPISGLRNKVRKPFTQDGRIYTGTGEQITGYWVAWKFTVSNFPPLVEIPYRPLCGLLCVFWDVPNRNLFRFVSSEKGVKRLSSEATAATPSSSLEVVAMFARDLFS